MQKRISLLLLFALYCCTSMAQKVSLLSESFEKGTKATYQKEAVILSNATWEFDNAVLGKIPSDAKNGNQSVRIKNGGIYLLQDLYTTGNITVQLATALFGKDKATEWQLCYSADGGKSWLPASQKITTTSYRLTVTTIHFLSEKQFRIGIRNFSDNRLNVDDLLITTDSNSYAVPVAENNVAEEAATTGKSTPAADHTAVKQLTLPGRDQNMTLGNPSKAGNADPDNYLVANADYTLSYNNSRGTLNWASWHLSTAWKGNAKRCNCFEKDKELPASFFHASTADYNNSGFDRGHICPSDDRDATTEENAMTFLMDNIVPQSPNLNQKTWERLEAYSRKLCEQGNELYIIAGVYGKGGGGKNGTMQTLADGKITVPSQCWKVIVVLPAGDNDLQRINPQTRIIAVNMPNNQSVSAREWTYYRTSVDAIEKATGYNLLDKLPEAVQKVIEAKVDNGADR